MKDTLITARRKILEFGILLSCFAFANLLNIWSIIAYKSSWKEIYQSIFYVLLISLCLYFLVLLLRLIFFGIVALFARKDA